MEANTATIQKPKYLGLLNTISNAESAAGVYLEAWADVTPEWAAEQKLPDDLAARLPSVAVAIKVAPEPNRPLLKRVGVEVKWKNPDGTPTPPVTMTGLFAAREKRGAP